MTDAVRSVAGVSIRLTDERWAHITEGHCELAGMRSEVLATVAAPERVLEGGAGERLAIRQVQPGKYLAVVYRESGQDGFIITAFLTRRARSLERRRQLWP